MTAKTKKRNNKNKILFRYGLITSLFVLLAAVIAFKLFTTTVIDARSWNDRARMDFSRLDTILPERGKLLASNGNILACNINVYDVKADLSHNAIKEIPGGVSQAELDALADSLDLYYPLRSDLQSLTGREFEENSWHYRLKVEMSKKSEERTKRLTITRKKGLEDFERIKGFPFFNRFKDKKGFRNPVYTERHCMRVYPYGNMARRSIGRVNERSNRQIHGFSGVEHDLDSLLFGQPGLAKKVTMTNGVANWVEQPAIPGYDIQTTFDIDLQEMLEEELTRVCMDAHAEWGTAILMEVATGEIKAIANVQDLKDGTYGEALNRALRGFEPGSVMKPISMMIAIEDGIVKNLNQTIECTPFQRTSDPHAPSVKNMRQVIEMSSNTGIARLIFKGYSAQPEKFYDRLASIGFFEPLVAGINYQETPHMRRLTEWNKAAGRKTTMTERHLDLARQAYGYNTTIPPIYTLAIYNAIANGGKFVRPHVMRRLTNPFVDSIIPQQYVRERICSERTAQMVRECLLQPVWGPHGTARAVQDERVKIAGKTGTAYPMRSDSGGGYDLSRRRYAFAGFFPYEKPKYSCMALVLGPNGNSANRTSGQVVKNIALKMYARGMLDNVSTFTASKSSSSPLMVTTLQSNLNILATRLGLGKIRTYAAQPAVPAGTVPNVKGYDAPSAIKILEQKGIDVTINGAGRVVAQSIPPGSPLKKGSKIKLTLSI